jgi:hypothetical protein
VRNGNGNGGGNTHQEPLSGCYRRVVEAASWAGWCCTRKKMRCDCSWFLASSAVKYVSAALHRRRSNQPNVMNCRRARFGQPPAKPLTGRFPTPLSPTAAAPMGPSATTTSRDTRRPEPLPRSSKPPGLRAGEPPCQHGSHQAAPLAPRLDHPEPSSAVAGKSSLDTTVGATPSHTPRVPFVDRQTAPPATPSGSCGHRRRDSRVSGVQGARHLLRLGCP